jgi:signal transduction histidine kinase
MKSKGERAPMIVISALRESIGLAVVKKLAEHHRDRISVGSEECEGATFLFTLPANDK